MAKKTAEQKRWEAQEKKSLAQLKNTQKLEINAYKDALKAAGIKGSALTAALSAEKNANKTEYAGAQTFIKQAGYNDLSKYVGADGLLQDLTRTAYSTFDPAQYGAVDERLNAALGLQSQFGIAPGVAIENGATGIPLTRLDKLLQEQSTSGSYGNGLIGRVLDYRTGLGDGKNLTAEQVSTFAGGKDRKIKPVKGQDGLYMVNFGDVNGDNKNYLTQYFTQNPDGTYNAASLDRFVVEAPDEGGIFGNKILDTLAGAAAAYFGGPIGAGLYTAASGGDLKDVITSAGLTWAGGQLTGTGSGAEGGSWYSPSGDITNPFGLLDGGWKPDNSQWLQDLPGQVQQSGSNIANSLVDDVMNITPDLGGVFDSVGSLAGSGISLPKGNLLDYEGLQFDGNPTFDGAGQGLKTPNMSIDSMGGGSGVTGTIDGLGTLTNQGVLIPAAGGSSALMPGVTPGGGLNTNLANDPMNLPTAGGSSFLDKLKSLDPKKLAELGKAFGGLLGGGQQQQGGLLGGGGGSWGMKIDAPQVGLLPVQQSQYANLFQPNKVAGIYDWQRGY